MDNAFHFTPSLRYFQRPACELILALCDRILIDLGTSMPARTIFASTPSTYGIYVVEAEVYARFLGRDRYQPGREILGHAFDIVRLIARRQSLTGQDRERLARVVCEAPALTQLTFTFCRDPSGSARIHLGRLYFANAELPTPVDSAT